VGARSQGCVGV
jgi:hypothetical protein